MHLLCVTFSCCLMRVMWFVTWDSRASEGPQEWSGYIEATQRLRIFLTRVARKNFDLSIFFTYEETALVASRYIEGHALTLCIYTVTV